MVAIGSVFAAIVRCPVPAVAQGEVTVRSDLLFYGDNTEFHNPFRKGETIFGAAVWLAAACGLNDRVTLSIGGFANQRFGSEHAFEQVRPVISLTVRGQRSAFLFGTLPAPTVNLPVGPDRGGVHQLLPPIQRETLAYDRPYESGLAWNFTGRLLQHHFWIAWQRLNTPQHRERFDGGITDSLRVADHVSLPLQLHIVHEGGQLYQSGPVADSAAAAAGIDLHGTLANRYAASLELFGLGSKHVPDRSQPQLSRNGVAFFGRVSAGRLGWRAHVIFWRARTFVSEEGDLNYSSMQHNGELYRGIRDYAEAGLARRFKLADTAFLEASARLHRVENHYEYSYRVLSVVSPAWKIH